VLLMAALAYYVLQQTIIRAQGDASVLKRAVRNDWKGKLSPIVYIVAMVSAFRWNWISLALYVFIALVWLIPDRRIERLLDARQ